MLLPVPARRLAAIVLALWVGAAHGAPVTETAPNPSEQRWYENTRAQWEQFLRNAGQALERGDPVSTLVAWRSGLESITRELRQVRDEALARGGELRKLLAALGPPPGEGEPPEEAQIAAKRAELEAQIARYDARVKEVDLIRAGVDQLLARLASRQRAELAASLFERGPSPLSPGVLRRAGPHVLAVWRQLESTSLADWAPALAGSVESVRPGVGLVLLLLGMGLIVPLRRAVLRRCSRERQDTRPSFARRVLTALQVALARGLLPALVALIPLWWLRSVTAERGIVGDTLVAALTGFAFVALISGVARAVLAPFSGPAWRPTPLTNASARALYLRIRGLSLLAAGLYLIEYVARRHLEIPEELGLLYDLIADTVVAALILSLLPGRLWQRIDGEAGEPPGRPSFPWARLIIGLAATAIPVAALLGYRALASYLAGNLLLTALLAGAVVVVHGVTRDLVALLIARLSPESEAGDGGGRIVHFWVVAAVDLALALGGLVVLLRVWGLPEADLRVWLEHAVAGITIGGLTISLTALLGALATFGAILLATRAFQRILETRIFPHTRLDVGLRHSLKTSAGYIGLVIALAAAVSMLGLDLSNLAIIAGALSVGIGFGLQNVVNNFVSGLILLVERPLKVGDWVEIGEHQGYVQRISVRATEIRTFQRSEVIIPNSELISSALVNWTHKDTYARVEIPVGVAYGSDTARVRELLLECARAHPLTNGWPAPYVLFMDFGDSSLDFELRLFIANADERLRVASDLRFAIDRAFREHGIEIPFPQRDLHLRGPLEVRRPDRPRGPRWPRR